MKKKKCIQCNKEFVGRADKKFCSTACKNQYNYAIRKATHDITKEIDSILHRNRVLLQTLMGEKRQRIKVDRLELDKMGFNFNYITGIYRNAQNKLYHYVYDYA